jgi:signal transduction histidine kinase
VTPTRWRLLIGRLAVTAGLVVFAAISYLGLVVGLGSLLAVPTAHPSIGLLVLATTVVVVALEPARRRLRQVALGTPREDQLVRITSELSGAMPAEDVLPQLARAVAEGTSAATVEIRARRLAAQPMVGRWPAGAAAIGDQEPGAVVRPIYTDGVRAGELILRPKLTRSGRPRRYPQAEQRLLDQLVARAGLTVENVQLRAVLRREIDLASSRADEVRTSRRRVIEASDAERHRLERDIHDGAQQHLVALSVNLGLARVQSAANPTGALATLDALLPAVQRAVAELDNLARGIYPRLLTASGVPEALAALGAAVPAVTLTVPKSQVRWPRDVEAAVYFTCAEAIQNATKYAQADRIDVRLDATDDEVSFEVHDDGVGFELLPEDSGTGLTGMRDRVEALGGVLRVSSAPGRGTTVSGSVPLRGAVG